MSNRNEFDEQEDVFGHDEDGRGEWEEETSWEEDETEIPEDRTEEFASADEEYGEDGDDPFGSATDDDDYRDEVDESLADETLAEDGAPVIDDEFGEPSELDEGEVYHGDQIGEEGYHHGDIDEFGEEAVAGEHYDEHAAYAAYPDEEVIEHFDEEPAPRKPGRGSQAAVDHGAQGSSKLKAGLMVGGIMSGLVASGVFGLMALGVIGGGNQPAQPQPTGAYSEADQETINAVEAELNRDEAGASSSSDPVAESTPPVTPEGSITIDEDPVEASIDLGESNPGITKDEVETLIQAALADYEAGVPQAFQDQVSTLQETIATQNETLAAYREEIVSINERLASMGEEGSAEIPGDLAKRLDSLEKNMQTALANSRIALRTSRELEDRGVKPARTASKPSSQSNGSVDGWKVSGMGGNRAMVESPNGETYLVSPGDKVPGLGRVKSIETQSGAVVTQSGRIGG